MGEAFFKMLVVLALGMLVEWTVKVVLLVASFAVGFQIGVWLR